MKKILTSLSALYEQNIISFSPKKIYLEMLIDTNTTNYDNDKYKILLQSPETFEIGSICKNGECIYAPERLFIELNKFPLENTIKNEALNNLKIMMNPELVDEYYNILKNKILDLDHQLIKKYLNKTIVRIEQILKKEKDKKTIVREYIMTLISKKEFPISIIKGGSAVELYTTYNRATLDIDTHADQEDLKTIIKFLKSKNNSIYFKTKEDEKSIDFNKKIIKLDLIPSSKETSIKSMLKNIEIKICFNTSFSNLELAEIKENYKITKTQLRKLKNSSAIIFTREMLLAEKYQSIISKPEISTRTKDLIDLNPLWNEGINYQKFEKWFFRKWSVMNNPKNQEEAIFIVNQNKDKELTKIKDNFEKAKNMYDFDISYNECIKIYKTLTSKLLENNKVEN